jgi:valyl-tRNA synthetase
VVSEVLAQVRKAKSEASRSMRASVDRLVVSDSAERLGLVRLGSDDLREAGSVTNLELVEGGANITVELAADPG